MPFDDLYPILSNNQKSNIRDSSGHNVGMDHVRSNVSLFQRDTGSRDSPSF